MLIKHNHTHCYAYTANQVHQAERDTIVLVHGAAMDHSVWSLQSRYFAYHGYNVAALDLPGHGHGHGMGGAALGAIPAIGQWLNGVIENLVKAGAGPGLHIVGHSMGALAALEAAARLTEAARESPVFKSTVPASPTPASPVLKSLSLVGFAYPMAVTPALLNAAENDPPAAYSMMTQWSHASKIGGEPMPGFWSPGMQMSMLENSPRGVLLKDLSACNAYANGEHAMAAIRCPVLFICGRLDRMAPAKLAAAQAANCAHAEIAFIPNCGHNLMAEAPDGVLGELKGFIGRHRSA